MTDPKDDDERKFDTAEVEPVFGSGGTAIQPALPRDLSMPTQRMVHEDLTQQIAPSPGVPTKIGRYAVLDRLGAGGMAEVFLAKQDGPAGFEKTVVIKRSFPHLVENERYVDMFMREAKIAARLNHPNVVQIYDFGEDESLYFIAMEFVDGLTLHRMAKRAWRLGRSLPMEVILRAIADAALGLNHAHSLRSGGGKLVTLVHRDISPDNLMINRDGVTKVLDFGIAKASDTQSVTRTGEIKGKIPFMSPEQVQGMDIDGRSDLYSLGVCFYWLLTGKRPFQGSSDFVTMQSVIEDQPEKPSHYNPSVPPEIDEIVLKLISKKPEDRYASGQEVHDVISRLLESADRVGSREFINELMSLDADKADNSEAPITASEGFLPATPISSRLIRSSEIVEPPRRSSPMPFIAAGGAAVLVLAALVLVFALRGGEDELQPPPISAPIIVTPPSSDPPPDPAPPVDEDPGAEDPAEDPGAADPVDEDPSQADPGDESPDPADPADESPSAEDPVDEDPGAEDPGDESADPEKQTKRRVSRPLYKDVTLKGPGHARFQVGGRWVRAGDAKLSPRARSVRAKDARYGGTIQVPIKGSVADWASVPEGRMQFRVYPWAEVTVGGTKLGKTPLPALKVPAGTYKVTLRYQEQVKSLNVTVRGGALEQVKARF